MKPDQEDSRLTAYVLGELSTAEAAAVKAAATADPSIRRAIKEIEQMSGHLSGVFGNGGEKLTTRNRQNILKAAKEAARQGKIIPLKSQRSAKKSWLVPIAAAAAISAGLFLLNSIPSPKTRKTASTASKIDAMSVEKSEGVRISRGDNISILPLEAGKRSLSQVTTAIRMENRLPTKDEVRIEEMLNAFPLKAKGSVALWQSCSLGAEIITCPWKPSGNLLIVSLQGAQNNESEVSLEFRANENSLLSHHLLGYSNGKPTQKSVSTKSIAPGESFLLVMETVGNSTQLGELIWTVNGTEAPVLALVHEKDKEPSEDASFAALVSAFGLWLRGEGKPMVDDAVVLGLAREVAAGSIVPDRYDFLILVDQAMKLAGKTGDD